MKLLHSMLFLLLCNSICRGQQIRNNEEMHSNEKQPLSVFNTTAPSHDYDIILNSPKQTTICLSIMFYKDTEAYIEYNDTRSEILKFKALVPQKIELERLMPNRLNKYTLYYRHIDAHEYTCSKVYEFKTIPSPLEPFSFTITADSHLDENCDVSIYKNTMEQAAKENPSFHIDLGDTFMVDKYRDDYTKSYAQYIAQRFYFSLLCNKCPLFLVQGNHDGEGSDNRRGMTEWAKAQREMLFPTQYNRNYYSFEWGKTLIVVLDPFSCTQRSGMKDPWNRTLGKEQYEWLKCTLLKSGATHKFVFIHNLVGGIDIKGKARGGAEAAKLYEWGGYSESGIYDFKVKRPDWDMPIHDLLKKCGVSVVFHGHDHVYANQEYDGIKYICVPQPSIKNKPGNIEYAKEYGYCSGILKNQPGFINVSINKNLITVEYITSNGFHSDILHIENSPK